MPFVRRTFATFRRAEFGFFGVRVITCRQTPRRNGQFFRAGDLLLYFTLERPLRTSWLIVGIWLRLKVESVGNSAALPETGHLLKFFSSSPISDPGFRRPFSEPILNPKSEILNDA